MFGVNDGLNTLRFFGRYYGYLRFRAWTYGVPRMTATPTVNIVQKNVRFGPLTTPDGKQILAV